MEQNVFKTAILVDLLDIELTSLDLTQILDSKLQSRFRNLTKGVKLISSSFNEMIEMKKEDPEYFGELCDAINKGINNFLKQ